MVLNDYKILHSRKNFNNDIKRGEEGEIVFYEYFLQNGEKLIDTRKIEYFMEKDIDFILDDIFSNQTFEIKTDYLAHRTGNIPWEKYSYYSDSFKTTGCFEKTEATYLVFYIYHLKKLIFYRTKELREYVRKNEYKFPLKNIGDNAKGYLLRIEDTPIMQEVYLKDTLNLTKKSFDIK